MSKRIFFLVFIVILAFLFSSCKNPIDIFKSFIRGEPVQDEIEIPEDFNDDIPEPDLDKIGEDDEDYRQTTLYYRDGDGYIVPVVRKFIREEGIARAALLALVDSNENRSELRSLGLQPILPANIDLELAIKEDGLVRASFSDEILKAEDKEKEESMVSAIVYTLTEFETIDRVQILVNNEIRDTLTYGTEIKEPIDRGNINGLNNPVEGDHSKLTLYMYNNPTGQYTYFVPVTKNIPTSSKNVEGAVKELIASKGEIDNLELNIPEGTTVFSVNMEEGVALVSFSEHLAGLKDVEEIDSITKAIGLTLKEFEGVEAVKLVVNGENTLEGDKIAIPTITNSY